jgi:predicted nucleic acid-binding Zn ribbon protein
VSPSRKSRPVSSPRAVGEIIERLLRRRGLSAKVEAASVVPEWPSLVGPRIAAVTRPQRVSNEVLFVAVTSSAWMMELNMMKGELMRRINAGKKEGRIRQVIFLMAES